MIEHDDIERRREMNEGVHLARDDYDETGYFAVRCVFADGVDRTSSRWPSLRLALAEADRLWAELKTKGYGKHNAHVGVIDEDDPERGELDWEDVS